MIIDNKKTCKQFSLPLFAWADAEAGNTLKKHDAISTLQKEFRLSYHMAKTIAENQDYSISNQWGL